MTAPTIPKSDTGKIYTGDCPRFWANIADVNGILTGAVVATAQQIKMILVPPSGAANAVRGTATQYNDPVAGLTTWLYYDCVTTDLSEAGQWMFGGYIVDSAGKPHHGTQTPMMIYQEGE